MPPEVGYAETSSDIVNPMIRMNTLMIGQDQEIEIGPPLFQPAPKLVKQPARIEMIENEMAKFENPDQLRERSWLYPISARRLASASRFGSSVTLMRRPLPPGPVARQCVPGHIMLSMA